MIKIKEVPLTEATKSPRFTIMYPSDNHIISEELRFDHREEAYVSLWYSSEDGEFFIKNSYTFSDLKMMVEYNDTKFFVCTNE